MRKHLTTNNLRYQSYDPAYDRPPGIVGGENDTELNKFANDNLRKIEISKPEQPHEVPKYLYRLLSLVYILYNKQSGLKITSGSPSAIVKCSARITRALVIYTQGKRSKTAINEMIKELETVEFAKGVSKRVYHR